MKYAFNRLDDPQFWGLEFEPKSTCHHNFAYRMGAGFAGDVGRFHPFTIEPCRISATSPPLTPGVAVVMDPATMSVRALAAGDTALTSIYGITVRAYPTQGGTPSSAPFGRVVLGTPGQLNTDGAVDVLRMGYIMAPVVGNSRKGDPVFVWIAASGGGHVQGGFEAAAGAAGNTIQLAGATTTFNSVPDANGITEIAFNI
jgi:hypothetical protein